MEKILRDTGKLLSRILLCSIVILNVAGCTSDKGSKMESEDYASVLTLILNIQEVEHYLHPEIESRVPINISTKGQIPVDLEIIKYKDNVQFFKEIKTNTFLDVIQFDIKGSTANYHINYDIEGISIIGNANKENGTWEISDNTVIEN